MVPRAVDCTAGMGLEELCAPELGEAGGDTCLRTALGLWCGHLEQVCVQSAGKKKGVEMCMVTQELENNLVAVVTTIVIAEDLQLGSCLISPAVF